MDGMNCRHPTEFNVVIMKVICLNKKRDGGLTMSVTRAAVVCGVPRFSSVYD